MAALAVPFAFVGRVGLSLLFIMFGIGKLMDPSGVEGMMASNPYLGGMGSMPMGWAVGLFELIAGIFILVGFMTRFTSLLLAGFCVLTALFFHTEFGDQAQQAAFLKNIAIAGGFLILFAYGNTRASLDSFRAAKKEGTDKTVVTERVVHDEALDGEDIVVTERKTTTTD